LAPPLGSFLRLSVFPRGVFWGLVSCVAPPPWILRVASNAPVPPNAREPPTFDPFSFFGCPSIPFFLGFILHPASWLTLVFPLRTPSSRLGPLPTLFPAKVGLGSPLPTPQPPISVANLASALSLAPPLIWRPCRCVFETNFSVSTKSGFSNPVRPPLSPHLPPRPSWSAPRRRSFRLWVHTRGAQVC